MGSLDREREHPPLETESTALLLSETLEEAKELVKLEIALARDDAMTELGRLHAAYAAILICVACTVVALSALVAGVVVAFGLAPALVASGVMFAIAAVSGAIAYRRLPLHPLARTRERLAHDADRIRRLS